MGSRTKKCCTQYAHTFVPAKFVIVSLLKMQLHGAWFGRIVLNQLNKRT